MYAWTAKTEAGRVVPTVISPIPSIFSPYGAQDRAFDCVLYCDRLAKNAAQSHEMELIMNSKHLHKHVIGLVTWTFLQLLRPVKLLSLHNVIPGHFEQRNVNGFVTQIWIPMHRRGSLDSPGADARSARDENLRLSGGAGTKVNYAAAQYMASLRLEPAWRDSCKTDTSLACA